jgi:hypothetical protein
LSQSYLFWVIQSQTLLWMHLKTGRLVNLKWKCRPAWVLASLSGTTYIHLIEGQTGHVTWELPYMGNFKFQIWKLPKREIFISILGKFQIEFQIDST